MQDYTFFYLLSQQRAHLLDKVKLEYESEREI